MPDPTPDHVQSVKWYGWKPDKPDYRDRYLTPPPVVEAPALPARYITPWAALPPIRNQGEQGSCVGHSVRTVGMAVRRAEHQMEFELSPRFIYWGARYLEGTTGQDAGCEIRDAVKAVARWGFAKEKLCPYNPKRWQDRPNPLAYADAKLDLAIEYKRVTSPTMTKDQALRAIKSAFVVSKALAIVFGFTVYENFEAPYVARTGDMSMPQGSVLGGHAVVACGYDDAKKACLVANSWDVDWGCAHPEAPAGRGRGYFWMPFDYISDVNLCDDFWIITKIS